MKNIRIVRIQNATEEVRIGYSFNYSLCSFAMTNANKDAFGSIMKAILMKQTNIGQKGNSSLSYLISELLDNIYEHSQSPCGYLFSQYSAKEGVINLCIADTSITIAGS